MITLPTAADDSISISYSHIQVTTHLNEARERQLEAPVADAGVDPREVHPGSLRLFSFVCSVGIVFVFGCERTRTESRSRVVHLAGDRMKGRPTLFWP